MKSFCLPSLVPVLMLISSPVFAAPGAGGWQHEEVRRFPAMEANQGVAVDDHHFYAITNHAIGKYEKASGKRIAGWDGGKEGRLKHLNAGVVLEGRLYCAHSNFPDLPEQSSVEIWDTETLKHLESRPFNKPPGSLTWIDRRNGEWFACFAHYKKSSDPALSRVVKYDAQWNPTASYAFPKDLIEKFGGNSSSGGSFGPEGHLFVTGHDAPELYVLDLPKTADVQTSQSAAETLTWRATISVSAAGQAFAWDRQHPGMLYSIQRKTKEVIVSRIGRGLTDIPPSAAVASSEGGFEALFDGRTFNGWEQKGNWVIEDGAFYRKAKGGPLTYTVKPIPDDFELRFEWKVSKGCNSGVYYRPSQYEYQVLDNVNSPYGENPRQAAASLFFCMAPSRDATRPLGEWNEGRVMCKGTVIQHWLNGEKVIDFDYTDPKWAKEVELLRIRGADLNARGGRLWLQDHGQDVWFRSIRLRTLPQEEQLARSEFKPMPIPPAAQEKENARVQGMLKAKKR